MSVSDQYSLLSLLTIAIHFVFPSSSSLPLHFLHLFSIISLYNKIIVDYWGIEYDVISTIEYQYWPRLSPRSILVSLVDITSYLMPKYSITVYYIPLVKHIHIIWSNWLLFRYVYYNTIKWWLEPLRWDAIGDFWTFPTKTMWQTRRFATESRMQLECMMIS